MAIRREEDKLGAFTLFRHFLRLMGFVRGQRWLLAACVVGSMAQAGIELSLPLLTRRGIDAYVLPPFMRVQAEGKFRGHLDGTLGAIQDSASPEKVFVPSVNLTRADRAEIEADRKSVV